MSGAQPGANQLLKEKQRQEEGSKILLSRLPVDVGESEIEVRSLPVVIGGAAFHLRLFG
jgi:hypothetical protein